MKVLWVILMWCWVGVLTAQEKHVLLRDSADERSITKQTFQIRELEVKARLADHNIRSGSTGITFEPKLLELLPRVAGESDPFKAIQYLGGVSVTGEANSGLYVRGGNNDQNLILFNGALIQNPNHVLGIFSVFNPDIVESMNFMKAAIPTEYGGRLSAVVDVESKKNIPDSMEVSGNLGFISSKLAVSLPLSRNFAVYASGRTSYLGKTVLPVMTKLGVDSLLTGNSYEFWDLNAGFTLMTKNANRLSGHFYKGKDEIKINQLKKIVLDENNTGWSNTSAGLEYFIRKDEHTSFTQRLNFSKFEISTAMNWYGSDYSIQSDFSQLHYNAGLFKIIRNHKLKAGLDLFLYQSNPHFINADSAALYSIISKRRSIYATQQTIYLRDEWERGPWQFNLGVRLNHYQHFGPYSHWVNDGEKTENTGKNLKNYVDFEPRLFARYLLAHNASLKISASRMVQYLNQVPISNFGIPADLNLPAGLYVLPQKSWHFSGGYFVNLWDNDLEFSAEIYYKTLENQLEFTSSLGNLFSEIPLEQNLLKGRGWSYGMDSKLKFSKGNFTSWVNYNPGWSYRQFDQINDGLPYLANNDRRNNLSVVLVYHLNPRLDFSAVFVYADGNRLNLPLSWYVIEKKIIFEYGKYNAFQMPAYHRLDFSANYKLKTKGHLKSELNLSVYNVYNRANPYNVYFNTTDEQGNQTLKLKMAYLLPIIPSLSWKFFW